MGYTDRLNLNPQVRTPFSLFTPPHKIIEALNAVPGAVREGLENLWGIERTPVAPPVAPPAPEAATARSATEPAAEAETEMKIETETVDEDVATSEDDELDTTPTVEKTPGGPVVTLRDGPRSAFGGNRTGPRTAQSPARSEKSGQDSRDRGAEAA
jgi:hypothetical protein